MNFERLHRTAPARNFNGGYTGHGFIAPMERPGLLARIFRRKEPKP